MSNTHSVRVVRFQSDILVCLPDGIVEDLDLKDGDEVELEALQGFGGPRIRVSPAASIVAEVRRPLVEMKALLEAFIAAGRKSGIPAEEQHAAMESLIYADAADALFEATDIDRGEVTNVLDEGYDQEILSMVWKAEDLLQKVEARLAALA